MANLKVTILHDVWEEGPPEPEPEPVKAPRGKNGKRRKKKRSAARPRRDLRGVDQARTRTFLSRPRRQESIAACAGKVRRRPRLQPHGVLRRRRHDGQEHRRLSGTAAHSVYRRRPEALYLAQDKSIAKKIFDFHKIKTPDFATSYKGRTDHSHDIEFPLIVKPVSEDGSIGIDSGCRRR